MNILALIKCIELSFRFKYSLPLNIAIKLNPKKMTKGILVISYFSIRIFCKILMKEGK
jgi:hypothetical protein